MNIAAIIALTIKISVFLIAVGYGMQATPYEAFSLFRNPGKLIRSLLSMNVVMLVFAILVVKFFDLPVYVNVILLALAVSPLPPLFPKKSTKAGGEESYIIGLLVACALFSIILIPVSLAFLDKIFDKPVVINSQAIFLIALITVIIPLFLGVALHHFVPVFTQKAAPVCLKTGQILLLFAILPVAFVMFPTVKTLIGNGTVMALAGFVVVGLVVGNLLGGPNREDRVVLSLASATRHPGIAIAVAAANLPDQKLAAATVILYLVVSAIIGIPYLIWIQRKKASPPA